MSQPSDWSPDQLVALGELFVGRLSDEKRVDAISYVDFCEPAMALETLCDHLGDDEVPISPDEYRRIFDLANAIGIDDMGRVTYLKHFVVDT